MGAVSLQCMSETVECKVLSISEFCKENGIGRTTFHKMQKNKIGPRLMRVGARVLVPIESAAEWRKRMTDAPVDTASD